MTTVLGWKTLRTNNSIVDDPDWVLTQTKPPHAEPIDYQREGLPSEDETNGVTLALEFLDTNGDPVTGALGSYDISAIEVFGFDPRTVVNSTTLTGVPGYRKLVLDSLAGADFFGVRITNITAPAGGVGYRVFYKEF